MKKGFFVALLLLSRVVLWAQWHDNVWLLGYNSNSADPLAEGIRFVFDDSLQISYEKRPVPFADAYASFCDSSGRLLLHSNGCFVADSSGRPIPGSEGMNPGILHDIDCLKKRGYNLAQSMVLLQDPGNSQVFHFFHVPLANPVGPTDLLHTAVDLGANGGEGSTLFKNRVLVSDTIHYDGLHAVRHANGRDWWVVAAKQRSNKYYLLLLDPQGVRVQEQLVGVPTVSADRGEMAFSPDGRRLARYNPRDGLRLFDFDRCTGTLYHPQYIEVSGVHIGGLYAGMGWSADSRYLYLTDAYKLFQFDVHSSDVASSRVLIAEAENVSSCPLGGTIGFMDLGPDGIMYIRPYNGQRCMHRMVHPERAGKACRLEQNYYRLVHPYRGMPHFPNFRLGPVDGSACDTLGLDNRPLSHWRYERAGGLRVDFVSVSWYEPEWYYWDFGDPGSGLLNYSDQKYPSHEYPAPGPYQVCLTVGNSYGTDTKCKTVWVLSTSSAGEGLVGELGRLYPNPSSGQLFWSGESPVRVRLFGAAGQLVLEEVTDGGALWVGHLPEGFYVAQVFDARDRTLLAVQKVVLKR